MNRQSYGGAPRGPGGNDPFRPRPSTGPGPRGSGPPGRPDQGPAAIITDQDARKIIVEGDAELLVERAQSLAGGTTAAYTAVRRLYGEALRIDMLWRDADRAEAARRRVILLKPRLAYQASRNSQLSEVKDSLDRLLAQVGGERERFQRFLEFFEAFVAYYKKR